MSEESEESYRLRWECRGYVCSFRGAVSSNPPRSCVLNPPAARTLVNPRLPTPGLVYRLVYTQIHLHQWQVQR